MEFPNVSEDVDVSDALLLAKPAFMDVRAPVEFQRGAVPGAVNIPILNDAQRDEIGTVYAEAGQDAAIARGLELATPSVREARLARWREHVDTHPDGYLYCFRGGLRSRTTQQWLRESGVHYPLVRGGYKALRSHFLHTIETLSASTALIVVSGATGSGKTELIHAWPRSLDLEGRANHRGSAFGGTFSPQPSQIDFENQLALDWMTLAAERDAPVVVESESQLIGRMFVPQALQDAMQRAPTVQLDAPLSERIARLRADYVDHALGHFRAQPEADDPWTRLTTHVVDNLKRIQRRLGGETTSRLVTATPHAVAALRRDGDTQGFDAIIQTLLVDYYDKLYQHKADIRAESVVFTGSHDEVLGWLSDNAA